MLIMRGFLVGLVTATAAQAQNTITDDSYFFGQSPPFYPSPNTTGTGKWAGAYAKAVTMVGQMTLEEKVSLTSGVSSNTSCVGVIPAIERLGFAGICVSDAGQGLRVRCPNDPVINNADIRRARSWSAHGLVAFMPGQAGTAS